MIDSSPISSTDPSSSSCSSSSAVSSGPSAASGDDAALRKKLSANIDSSSVPARPRAVSQASSRRSSPAGGRRSFGSGSYGSSKEYKTTRNSGAWTIARGSRTSSVSSTTSCSSGGGVARKIVSCMDLSVPISPKRGSVVNVTNASRLNSSAALSSASVSSAELAVEIVSLDMVDSVNVGAGDGDASLPGTWMAASKSSENCCSSERTSCVSCVWSRPDSNNAT